MIENKYSLNYVSYDKTKLQWKEIQEDVKNNEINSLDAIKKYKLSSEQLWFLYDKLLQEKYNHLYKREKLVNPKVNDFVYCDYDGFGRGTIVKMFEDNLMLVEFDKRDLPTMCDSKLCITVHDEVKRKITRL